MIFIHVVAPTIYSGIVLYFHHRLRKTDQLFNKLYFQISYLRQYIRAKELGDEEEALRMKNKIWMDDLRKSYSLHKKYGDPMDWKWVNKEEGK